MATQQAQAATAVRHPGTDEDGGRVPESVEQLWRDYVATRDVRLRERLILQYAPLVKWVVGRLAIRVPVILDREDILSYGTIGLMQAVDRYLPDRGVSFQTFAMARIRGAIIDSLRSLDWWPRSVKRQLQQLATAEQQFRERTARAPSRSEIAASTGLSGRRQTVLREARERSLVSLERLAFGEDGDHSNRGLQPVADDGSSVTESGERAELIATLGREVGLLPEREQAVLALYYQEGLTLREIAEVLGLSESRICQLHRHALRKLQAGLQRFMRDDAA